MKDVKNCGTGYTTIIDETTTNQNIKQLDNLFPNNLPECFLEGLQVLTFHWIPFKQRKKPVYL